MKVVKRNGKAEDISFDKITRRIRFLLYGGLDKNIDPVKITIEVNDRIYDKIPTTLLDDIAAEICIAKTITHPDFGVLASRIAINNYQKNTTPSFFEVMSALKNNMDVNGLGSPLISDEFYKTCEKYRAEIDGAIVHNRDYLIDYFGFKTLFHSYLMKINGRHVERIQHMWMRCSLFLHQDDIGKAVESYNLISQKYFTHATPSLFNAGCVYPQMSSCYLLSTEDSIEGIFGTITKCAKISKWAGGIGVHISNIRSKGAHIRKTNGRSSGILPMLKVFDATASYVNQAGRRKGSFAIYLEPHHPDIFDFLEAKLNTGSEEKRARNLFYALWVSDYFMRCVEENSDWYLMDPDNSPDLNEFYGEKYVELYKKYISEKRFVKKIKARDIWNAMIKSQIETGIPYVCFKDAVNNKSNQKNIGTIKSSNLCSEIMQYSDSHETSVCFTGDTQVLTRRGYRRIDECDGAEVLSYYDNDRDLNAEETFSEARLIDNGVKDVYELRCAGIKSIKGTSGHLFLTCDPSEKTGGYKWKKLEDLAEGDKIVLPSTGVLPEYDINRRDNPGSRNAVSENIEREDPARIFHFLTGLFSLRGEISSIGNAADIRLYGSAKLSFRVQNLLRCFGIFSTVTKIYDEKEGIYRGVLSICKIKSVINFDRYIGFGLSREKQERLDSALRGEKAPSETMLGDYTEVISVAFAGKERVYDLNIPERHNFIAGGVVVHNCNLSSIGLPMFLEPRGGAPRDEKMVVYTVKKCDWCRLAKAVLKENKIKFVEKFMHTEEEKNEIKRKYSAQTFPQVIKIGGGGEERIGGFTELIKLLRPKFNFQKLYEVTKTITRNLNRVIDLNYYPTDCTKNSNLRNRPMGIGVQGLADVFMAMKIPFESEEARELNRNIFETVYYSSMETSMELAAEEGPYSSYEGSPLSEGKFQFDLWDEYRSPRDSYEFRLSGRWDFEGLMKKIRENGVRNSLLVAPMPTASTSQILGNNEAFEPYTSNIYTRRTLAGEFPIINKHLVKDLINCNLWTAGVKEKILFYKGSVQNIKEIPPFLKKIYKTVWEIKQKTIIDMAADRGHFVCQSQSLNIHVAEPSNKIINSVLFYGWKRGLKTGIYYLRTLPSSQAQQVSIDPEAVKRILEEDAGEEDECIMCSS